MDPGLYAIADLGPQGADPEALAGALLACGPAALQLRWKDPPGAGAFLEVARRLADRCRARGIPFIVNDRVDVAALAGADGVHLGQDDLPLAAARRLLPPGTLVGVSTHTLAQVEAAVADGADYLGFGPVFATATKARPDRVVGLEGLAAAVRAAAPVPVVAIGGLGLDTVADVAATGALCAAVIGDVLRAGDVGARAAAVHQAFLAARPAAPEGPAR